MGQNVKISEIKFDRTNANKGTERGRYAIEASMREFGFADAGTLDRNNTIIGGNKRTEVAGEIGMEDAIIIDVDGTKPVFIRRNDLDLDSTEDDRARRLAYALNRSQQLSLDWDAEQVLADLNAGMDLSGMWKQDELDVFSSMDFADENNETELTDSIEDKIDASKYERIYSRWDVPDALWPSDNDFGIPLLDINMQALSIDQPCAVWGVAERTANMKGTWLFYTEDYRYEALWTDPSRVINTSCINAVEPNFSCYSNMPSVVAMWQIYRKRWIARWWQSMGVCVIVDLNVAPVHYAFNRMGIPAGWRTFATRGYSNRLNECHAEYQQACEIAGGGVTPLFVVYGGGQAVKDECKLNGWLWIPEAQDMRKKRRIGNG
jgi:hypothetical protein